jgi:hypothetical protein
MRLKHFSDRSVIRPRTVLQREEYKPSGLWVSDEDEAMSWSAWTSNNFGQGVGRQYEHDVALATDHNVLILTTPDDMIRFTKRFAADAAITWQRVAEQYHGIIVTPYQWSQRYDLWWYYGWDCASGCIWNKDAIASIVMSRLPMMEEA